MQEPAKQQYVLIISDDILSPNPPKASDISKYSIYRAQITTSKTPIIFELTNWTEWTIKDLKIKDKETRVRSGSLMRWLEWQSTSFRWNVNPNSLLMVDMDRSVLPHALQSIVLHGV